MEFVNGTAVPVEVAYIEVSEEFYRKSFYYSRKIYGY
jgi:hypothetical protein